MTPPLAAPLVAVYRPCVQSFDLGAPIMETFAWPSHAWVVDDDRIAFSKYEPVVLTRRYRCVRCDETWEVSGEPAPGPRVWT